jgi:predicted ThiF/HesA family dinucleotide-utilizing enzyme
MEKHFTATETVRDVVIGIADGLTVPLAAGLSAAVSNTSVIVTAGSARNGSWCNFGRSRVSELDEAYAPQLIAFLPRPYGTFRHVLCSATKIFRTCPPLQLWRSN